VVQQRRWLARGNSHRRDDFEQHIPREPKHLLAYTVVAAGPVRSGRLALRAVTGGQDPLPIAEQLTYKYGAFAAVDDVSFDLGRGVTTLLGPNGAGKTTLLRLLATAARPADGHIVYDGRPVIGRNLWQYRRALGYLPEKPAWHSWMTVEETVSFFAWLRGIPRAERQSRVDEAIELVSLTTRRRDRLSKLSGGMFQRALLAQAIVHRPAVLILDEPSVGLDPEQRFELRRILRSIRPGGAVIVSTHILDDVSPLADHVLIMAQGKIRFAGSLNEVVDAASAVKTSVHSSELESAYLKIVAKYG
jgi:ABC-2 type transport system ATP-binding protein